MRLHLNRPGGRLSVVGRRLVGGTAAATTYLWLAATVFAASPSPAPGGDPRSSGQGPGLIGDPGFALIAVVAIGVGSVLATLAYVRLTPRKEP
jgi:hypothetical protein